MLDFDASSLYSSAMWVENLVYPKLETGFALKIHMNDVHVEALIDQTFNQDDNESAILKPKYYNPPDLIIQHLPVKEKVKNIAVNRMRNCFIIDALTTVDIQEVIEIGGRVIRIYEGVFQEYFKISTFNKVAEKLFSF